MKEVQENTTLALGQRRAESVRNYFLLNGITPSRISVKSYGEERPLASGNDEEVMQKIGE